MDHNYPLQNNSNNAHESNFIDNGFNGYSDNLQSTNIIQPSNNNTNSSDAYTGTSDNIIPTPASDKRQSTYSTSTLPYAPYIGHNVSRQNQSLLRNPPQNLPQYIQSTYNT